MLNKTQHQKIGKKITVHHAFIAANKLSVSVNKGEMLSAVCIQWACRLRDGEWNELWYLTFNHQLFLTNSAKNITLSEGHLPTRYVKLAFYRTCMWWYCMSNCISVWPVQIVAFIKIVMCFLHQTSICK